MAPSIVRYAVSDINYFESMEALHSNWHLSRNNQYICQLLCFVMGQNGYNSGFNEVGDVPPGICGLL